MPRRSCSSWCRSRSPAWSAPRSPPARACSSSAPSPRSASTAPAGPRIALLTDGLERRVWRLFAIGLGSWTLGCVPYLLFLATGGDVSSPAAWSQLGFLLAYPFWYRALWLLRQPALDESRRERWEGWAIELSVLAMLFVIVVGTIWESSLPAVENIALLVPVVLDLLLLAALYNAIRRSSLSRQTAFIWFAFAFIALAITDGLVTFLVTRGHDAAVIGPTMLGYMLAMALLALAARRPIRVTEAQAVLGPSKTLLAAIGLMLSGPASVLAPAALRPLVWLVAAALFWRLCALLRQHGQSDTDQLTGFLEPRAFSRHVGGVIQAASSGHRALLVAVDIDGFGLWNGQNGFSKGDSLLSDLGRRLEDSGLAGGVWSRLHADRFAWIGIGHDAESGRHLAELVQSIASQNEGGLTRPRHLRDPPRRRRHRRQRHERGRGGPGRRQGRQAPGRRLRPRPPRRRRLHGGLHRLAPSAAATRSPPC